MITNKCAWAASYIFALTLYGCSARAQEVTSVDEVYLPVFELTGPGQHGFLAASMHADFQSAHKLSESLRNLPHDRLILEFDPVPWIGVASPLLAGRYALSERDKDVLVNAAGAKLGRLLELRTGKSNESTATLRNVHPYIIADALERECGAITSTNSSPDMLLRSQAVKLSIPIQSLETFDESLATVLEMTGAQWVRHLSEVIDAVLQGTCSSGASAYSYLMSRFLSSGELDSLYSATRSYHANVLGSTVLFDALISKRRNANMARRISDAIQMGGRPLIVVGGAHFAGSHGIVKMICALGIEVKPVPSTPAKDQCTPE